jgi:hypothetical protein
MNIEGKKKLSHITLRAAQFRCGKCDGCSARNGMAGRKKNDAKKA